jgi:hypothetical protein
VKIDKDECKESFVRILSDIQKIFPEDLFPLRSTRFKQKSDFYSFFAAIHRLHKAGYDLHDGLIKNLQKDLNIIHECVIPGEYGVFGDYATRCLSDANSKSSREWRVNFITNFLVSIYNPEDISQERIKFFVNILMNSKSKDSSRIHQCDICKSESEFDDNWTFVFSKGKIFLEQAFRAHKECLNSQSNNWVYVDEE